MICAIMLKDEPPTTPVWFPLTKRDLQLVLTGLLEAKPSKRGNELIQLFAYLHKSVTAENEHSH